MFEQPEFLLALVALGLALAVVWLSLELGFRLFLELPLRTDFYSSLDRDSVRTRQEAVGVRAASGPGWVHLGWVADPDREKYRIERGSDGCWRPYGRARFGSHLVHGLGGDFRVWAEDTQTGATRLLGQVSARTDEGQTPIFVPRIEAPWRTLFRPSEHGRYVNNHSIYRDGEGFWRLVGITSKSRGNPRREKYFTVGRSAEFPPEGEMVEQPPVAEFGELARAPHVIRTNGEGDAKYHMFWSPHALHQMSSRDGIAWDEHTVTMPAPNHKFFRDPMVLAVSEGQWLLYATARGRYYSQVDVYQSFDLRKWQYIRTALRTARGSERNSPFASTESPTVARYRGRYYLALTYANDSFFWPGLMTLLRHWPDPPSYNNTLVFHSANPYDFGSYRGLTHSPTLLTRLEAHAPELVEHPDTGDWYITTAGWPWVATLTSGEVAVAPITWEKPQSVSDSVVGDTVRTRPSTPRTVTRAPGGMESHSGEERARQSSGPSRT